MKTMYCLIALAMPLLLGVSQPVTNSPAKAKTKPAARQATGQTFQKYTLGQARKDITAILPSAPLKGSHLMWDEVDCRYFRPAKPLKLGGFTVQPQYVYLIFYQDRLFRMRVMNNVSGKRGADLAYYKSLKQALTSKYGQPRSREKVWNRYDGNYEWKTATGARITLTYVYLQYSHIKTEDEIHRIHKKKKQVTSSDI